MNAIIENMVTRRSIRGFKPEMPPRDVIDEIIKAGTYAPTGRGKQSPKIVCVTNRQVRDRLMAMNAAVMGVDVDPFYGAPVVLIVLADRSVPTHIYDGTLVMGNLLNAAHALGLGAVWIHRAKEEFDSPEGKALLKEWGIEGDYEGIGHCVLGYASAEPHAQAPRKPDYVHYVD